MPCFIVEKSAEGTALSEYLQGKIPAAPQAYTRQLIKNGKILCNGSPATPDQRVFAGEKITLPASKRVLEFINRHKRRPTVLYESQTILIVYKPSGLAIHAGKGHETDNLTARVKEMMRDRNEPYMTAPVHRLDLPTSGPVIFGKGRKAISVLGKMMQEQIIDKRYLALTRAGLPDEGLLSGQVPNKGKSKYAEARFKVIETQEHLTLLELRLLTGRQHQIRRQLSGEGFPIVGDERYRGDKIPGLNRLFLHCHSLSFPDPDSKDPAFISVPLPNDLVQCLKNRKFSFPAGKK